MMIGTPLASTFYVRLLLLGLLFVLPACPSGSVFEDDVAPGFVDSGFVGFIFDASATTTCPEPLGTGVGSFCSTNGVICSNCLTPCIDCVEIACANNVWVLEETHPSMCADGSNEISDGSVSD